MALSGNTIRRKSRFTPNKQNTYIPLPHSSHTMRAVFFILSILLLILAACEPTLRTIPTSQYQGTDNEQITRLETIDLCANVTCLSTQTCNQGNCENVETTTENAELEEPTICAFGEIFEDGECTCASDRFWCPEQNKCIPKGDCCLHTQCKRFERCVPTQYRVRLCADLPSGKLCRLLADNGRTEIAAINGIDVRFGVNNWYSDKTINFTLNNESVLIAGNQRAETMGSIFYYEMFEEYGGYCKPDED